jgi:hypothetical protein
MNNGFKRKLLLSNYYLLLIKEKTNNYIQFLHKARNLWLKNFKSNYFS